MKVKIDTKEIFHVICLEEDVLTANMADDLKKTYVEQVTRGPKHVIFDLQAIQSIDIQVAHTFRDIAAMAQENKSSFVICNLQTSVKKAFEEDGLLDQINYTPSQSEAWDIVQMEEIERELDAEW